MGNILWNSSWDIGQAEIDAQHQKWVALYNELEDAFLSEGKRDMRIVQRDTLEKMLDYTRYHFISEEKLMSEAGFPQSAKHWRLHKEFDKIIYQKYRDVENGVYILNSELLAMTRNWLLTHIQVADRKFGLYLQEKEAFPGAKD